MLLYSLFCKVKKQREGSTRRLQVGHSSHFVKPDQYLSCNFNSNSVLIMKNHCVHAIVSGTWFSRRVQV